MCLGQRFIHERRINTSNASNRMQMNSGVDSAAVTFTCGAIDTQIKAWGSGKKGSAKKGNAQKKGPLSTSTRGTPIPKDLEKTLFRKVQYVGERAKTEKGES